MEMTRKVRSINSCLDVSLTSARYKHIYYAIDCASKMCTRSHSKRPTFEREPRPQVSVVSITGFCEERIIFVENAGRRGFPPRTPLHRPRLGKECFFLQRREDRTPAGSFNFSYSALASPRVGDVGSVSYFTVCTIGAAGRNRGTAQHRSQCATEQCRASCHQGRTETVRSSLSRSS
jgi:hypothetical protein